VIVNASARKIGPMMPATDRMPAKTITPAARPPTIRRPRGRSPVAGSLVGSLGDMGSGLALTP
jgi:hypothetical protein